MISERIAPDTSLARTYAGVVGTIILVVGIMGFFRVFIRDDALFGLYQINTVHNLAHIVTGLPGLILAFYRRGRYALLYLLLLGFLYVILTLTGFIYNGDFFELAYFNLDDNLLHAGIALVTLIMATHVMLAQPDMITESLD